MKKTVLSTLLLLAAVPAAAQQAPAPVSVPASIPATPTSAAIRELPPIPLGTGTVPGGLPTEQVGMAGPMRMIRNVTTATLTPVLPDPAIATGAAVVVAPGGGFLALAIDLEGFDVARDLARHGIAAFVLKYRLTPTPVDRAAFGKVMHDLLSHIPDSKTSLPTPAFALEDGIAAMRLVRSRAATWGIDPNRVGMMGFSAGAALTLETGLHAPADAAPAFIAPIYGQFNAVPVPANAPPLFAAIALDDPLFGKTGFGLIRNWQAAGRPVEFHAYQEGGHGFGLGKPGTTTVGWINGFRAWLAMNGFLKAKP